MKAIELAKYIVNKCTWDGEPINNYRLQMILYCVQKHFKQKGIILIEDEFEMSNAGPYIPEVYNQYCGYGAIPIRLTYNTELGLGTEDQDIIHGIIVQKRKLGFWEFADEFVETDEVF